MRQALTLVLLALSLVWSAPVAAQSQAPQLDRRVQEAVVWRAARLRIEVAAGRLAEPVRAPTLDAAVRAWSASPATADPQREAQDTLALADRWIAYLRGRMATARWPGDRQPELYQREADIALIQARLELAYAMGSHGSPSQALAMIYMIDGWIEGIPFRPNPFSDIDADADAALAASLIAAMGPPPRDSGIAPRPGGANR